MRHYAFTTLCALVLALPVAASASITLPGGTYDDNAFADQVVSFTAGISFERQITGPFDRVATTPEDAVLGHDLASSTIEMTSGQTLTVAFTDNLVVNGAGDDLAIYELFSGAEFGSITINGFTQALVGVSLGNVPIPGTGFSNFVNLATIDLSDFGVAAGAKVSSLSVEVSGSGSEYAVFAAINSASIPEPTTLMIWGLGGVAIGLVRRRRAD